MASGSSRGLGGFARKKEKKEEREREKEGKIERLRAITYVILARKHDNPATRGKFQTTSLLYRILIHAGRRGVRARQLRGY